MDYPINTPLYLSLILNRPGLSKAMRRPVVITTVLDYNRELISIPRLNNAVCLTSTDITKTAP